MRTLLLFKDETNVPGLKMRSSTEGDELDLVNRFIDEFLKRHNRKSQKHDFAIFVEPLIDSGYPDIVIVKYKKTLMDSWVDARNKLCTNDMKILAFLMSYGGSDFGLISDRLGFSEPQVRKSVFALEHCRMVSIANEDVKPIRPMKFFGAIEITAYEAKVSDATTAIAQAVRNTRFANSSYVLLGSNSPAKSTIEACSKAGVGLIGKESMSKPLLRQRSRMSHTRECYITLMFNEWVARGINAGVVHA